MSNDKLGILLLVVLMVAGLGSWWWLDSQDGSEVDDATTTKVSDTGGRGARRGKVAPNIEPSSITGRVLGNDENALEDVAVHLTFEAPRGASIDVAPPAPIEVRTAADGSFSANMTGFWRVNALARPENRAPASLGAILIPGTPLDLGDLICPQGLSIRGRVYDDSTDEVIRGAVVRAGPPAERTGKLGRIRTHGGIDARVARETRTDDQGFFVLRGLPTRKQTLVVQAEGYSAAAERDLEAPLGRDTIEDLEIRLRSERLFRVKVRGKNGDDVRGAQVQITGLGYQPEDQALSQVIVQEKTTGSDGIATFRNLGARSLIVRVAAAGYLTPKDLTVTKDEDELDVLLDPGGGVLGVVRDKITGNPITEVEITAKIDRRRKDEVAAKVLRGEEATRQFERTGGAGYFGVAGVESPRIRFEIRAEGYVQGFVQVTGLESGELRTLDLELEPQATMSGTVLNHAYQALPNATVVAFRLDADDGSAEAERALINGGLDAVDPALGHQKMRPSRSLTTRADEAGRFDLGNLAEGRYKLVASHPEQIDSEALEYSVKKGGRVTEIELQTRAAGGVRGVVLLPNGRAAAGSEILVRTKPPEDAATDLAAQIFSTTLHRTWADAQGRFEILGIKPGSYGLVGQPPEYLFRRPDDPDVPKAAIQALRIRAGQDAEVTLQLQN